MDTSHSIPWGAPMPSSPPIGEDPFSNGSPPEVAEHNFDNFPVPPAQPRRITRRRVVALAPFVIALALAAALAGRSQEGEQAANSTPPAAVGGLKEDDCVKDPKVAEAPVYGAYNPEANVFAATGGSLTGNGPPLNTSSADAAVKDLYGRTESDPKLTANAAYVMRLQGFTPADETKDAMTADVAFLDARVASLVKDHKLWSQTRYDICRRLNAVSLDADPYKDRNLIEITTRVALVQVDDVQLPVTNVVLGRATQPDGVRLLWINRTVDTTGERDNKFPIAFDVQFAWPVIVGEVPESAEKPAPKSEEQKEQDEGFEQKEQEKSQERQQSGKGNDQSGGGSGATNGQGGGNNANQHNGDQNGCTGDCGQGNANQGNGQGPGDGGCGSNCPGGGGNTNTGSGSGNGSGCGTCGNGGGSSTTATTAPPVTVPPSTAPPTTRPPTTAPPTAPPTTRPPTTVPTTAPTTTIHKGDDPGCSGPGC